MALISIPDWGRSVGLARPSAYEAVKRCAIPVAGGQVDADVATMLYRRETRPRARPDGAQGSDPQAPLALPAADVHPPQGGGAAPGAVASGSDGNARRRRELADAERAELETARMAGRLIDRAGAERGGFEVLREVRDAAFAAVKTMARRVQGLTEVRDIELVMDDELRAAFAGADERMRARIEQVAAQ